MGFRREGDLDRKMEAFLSLYCSREIENLGKREQEEIEVMGEEKEKDKPGI